MPLKSIPLLASSHNSVLCLICHPTASITSSRTRPNPQKPRSSRGTRVSPCDQSRCYASVNGGSGSFRQGADLQWPSQPYPSPYDIFAIEKSAPYTKGRFYQLVKLYHPDRHHNVSGSSSPSSVPSSARSSKPSSHDGLSHAVRLERYRLVVLANDILSDPSKRHAYDAYGAGWIFDQHGRRKASDDYRAADRSWREKPHSAASNATWEDWERWYQARDGTASNARQQPLFMSNTHFVALILATIAVGTAMQASRANDSASAVVERRGVQEAAISDAMRQQQRATAGKGREERIEKFIRERQNLA